MAKLSLRRLLSRLTAIALSTSSLGVAAAAGPAWLPEDTELDSDAPLDVEQLDPHDAAAAVGRRLALALDQMRPLDATHIASTWAISDDAVRRLAIAHALEWRFPLVGDALVLDHLSRDPDPAVRAAAARAAGVRSAR